MSITLTSQRSSIFIISPNYEVNELYLNDEFLRPYYIYITY